MLKRNRIAKVMSYRQAAHREIERRFQLANAKTIDKPNNKHNKGGKNETY